MALSKAADFRELSEEEITAEIAKVKRDLFDLRFKKATRQMESGFHEFKQTRRKLAQLMTIERERQIAADGGNRRSQRNNSKASADATSAVETVADETAVASAATITTTDEEDS